MLEQFGKINNRYLLHTAIIPNELKASTCRNKIARVSEGKMGKYFNWGKVFLSNTLNLESMKEKNCFFTP